MPAAVHAPLRKRPIHQTMGRGLGKLSGGISELGKLAAIPRSSRRSMENRFAFEEEEAMHELPDIERENFDPKEPEHVEEYLQIALSKNNEQMIHKSMLFVARWNNREKASAFFRQFFEAEDERQHELGKRIYYEYLSIGGKPLGRDFERLDENFREFRKRLKR